MAIQPVTYRPVEPIKPVTRKTDAPETAKPGKSGRRRPKLPPGQGEHVDTYV